MAETEFGRLLAEQKAARVLFWNFLDRDPVSREYTHPHLVAQRVELAKLYKAVHKHRKFTWMKAKEALPEVVAKMEQESLALYCSLDNAWEELEPRLCELAVNEPFPQSAEWTLFESVSTSAYSTQGYGAKKYAESACRRYEMAAVFHGLKAEVRVKREYSTTHVEAAWMPYPGTTVRTDIIEFGCFVQTTEYGIEILKRRPDPPLRAQLQQMLKSGTNVRVYMPFLPYGYEESIGLDAWGKDIPGHPLSPGGAGTGTITSAAAPNAC